MTKLEDFKNEEWLEEWDDGRLVTFKQIVGKSGVYLVVINERTGEVLRDDRPCQMTA